VTLAVIMTVENRCLASGQNDALIWLTFRANEKYTVFWLCCLTFPWSPDEFISTCGKHLPHTFRMAATLGTHSHSFSHPLRAPPSPIWLPHLMTTPTPQQQQPQLMAMAVVRRPCRWMEEWRVAMAA
jgi:hypothetical protein